MKNIKYYSLMILVSVILMDCTPKKEVVINHFTVGHLFFADTLGPTRPVNVKKAVIKRESTIDFIYKIDSALSNDLNRVELYNGYFEIVDNQPFADSLRELRVMIDARTEWYNPESNTIQLYYKVRSLNDEVLTFDFGDGVTVYKRVKKIICKEAICDTVVYEPLLNELDKLNLQ